MKILIENHQGIGDVVHMLPVIENIRSIVPEAFIAIIVKGELQKALFRDGLIDEFIFWNNLDKKKIKNIRRQKFNYGILNVITNNIKGIIFLKFVCGCEIVISEFKFGLHSKKFLLVKKNEDLHRIDRNLRLTSALQIVNKMRVPEIRREWKKKLFLQNEVSGMHGKVKLGMCMGSNPLYARKGFKHEWKDVKQWPCKNIVELTFSLLNENIDILFFGGSREKYIKDEIRKIKSDHIFDYVNNCNLDETMDLLSICDLCVGVDTGLMHIAAALGVHTITLFGPTNPNQVVPRSPVSEILTLDLPCQHCYGKASMYECKDNICMGQLNAKIVREKILKHIEIYG